jgi:MtrB/PioB family decaheme-associated outer membrane protein
MRSRQRTLLGLGWTLLLLAGPAVADVDLGPATVSGNLEAGVRGISGDEASAKFDDYRDPSIGVFGAGELLFQDLEGKNYFQIGGFDLLEHDADYFFEGGRWGYWGVSGSYSLIPHVYSDRALSPYLGIDGGNLFLPFAPPADAAEFEDDITGFARQARLHFETRDWNFAAFFKPNPELEFASGYRVIDRQGRRADTLFYGFSNFVHFPEPVAEKVQEATADAKWVRDQSSIDLNYTGNFFSNDFRTYQLENPATFAGGSPLGAIAAAPDNSFHLFSLTGSTLLPTAWTARVAATIAYGRRFQDQTFVPLTVNPALSPNPLPAHDLDGDVQTAFANLLFTARPAPKVDVTARYRIYDYDNDSDEITFTQTSTDDAELTDETVRSTAPSYTTQNAFVETSYRFSSALKGTLGAAWDHWDRGREREVRHSDTFAPEVGLDWQAGTWGRFRTSYAYAWRSGDDYNELAPFRALEPGSDPAPLTPPIRKFSQADNERQTLHFLSQLFPGEDTDITLNGDFHLTEWTDGTYGLNSDDQFDLGIEATHRLLEQVEITLWYNYDWVELRQRSASSSGTLIWQSTSTDVAHTAGANLTWTILPDRLVFDGGYFIQTATGQTHTHGEPPDAVDYPEIDNRLWALFSNLSFRANENWTFVARYRYENYDQSDWQFDGLGVTRLTSNVDGQPLLGTNNDVFLRNGLEDYHAHFFSVSAILSF